MKNNDVELFIKSKQKKSKVLKITIIVFLLLLISISFVVASFSVTAASGVKLVKKWTSQEQTQVDPQHVFSNNMFMIGDSIYFTESEQIQYRGYLIEHIRSYDNNFNINKKLELGQLSYSTYFQQLGDDIYYANVDCYFPNSSYSYCYDYFYKTNENLEILDSFVGWRRGEFYNALNTDEVDTTVENILAKDDSGNLYIYVGFVDEEYKKYHYAGIINDTFDEINPYELTDEEMVNLFPDIKKMYDRENMYIGSYEKIHFGVSGEYTETVTGPIYNFTSITTLKNGNELYLGQTAEPESSAYFEIVNSDGVAIKKEKSDKYATYSNPVLIDDYIVVKATYDEDKTLGTLKSDLIVFDENGGRLYTLDTNSYFNNLILDGKTIITERVYVDGVCTASKANGYVTYSAWNVDSCNTYHYFEKYELEKGNSGLGDSILDSITGSSDENPNTEVFPIMLFVIISICLAVVVIYSLKKTRDLE